MCVCVCVCMCALRVLCVCKSVSLCVHVCVCVIVSACLCVCLSVHVHACVHRMIQFVKTQSVFKNLGCCIILYAFLRQLKLHAFIYSAITCAYFSL